MKKSNVTIIATALIGLHVLAFIALIGSRRDRNEATDSPVAPPAPTEPAPAPKPAPDVEVPQLVIPVEVVEQKPTPQRETIAVPGSRAGYLRTDRPSRRTSKVYSKLVGDPYQSAIVVDARTGKILFEDRASAYAYPASVTKMMTMLIVLEQIDAGTISLTDKVAITKEVAGIGGSEVYLDSRESGFFTVGDLLKALTIHSANDAARALALHVAGTREAFVDMMNRKARELGMNSTVYHTEHGLPPSGGSQPDISTAYDIALLSIAALRHPETLGYTGTKLAWLPKSSIRKEKFMLANRNALVGKEPYPGCDGLKTGYHSRGGYSLAATAQQDGKRVVSVVLGVADRNSRNATTRRLLDKGFQKLEK
jgi:D-alanyl-D-alanine carboxypeptidase (penicillin-binding protein 5/6)